MALSLDRIGAVDSDEEKVVTGGARMFIGLSPESMMSIVLRDYVISAIIAITKSCEHKRQTPSPICQQKLGCYVHSHR